MRVDRRKNQAGFSLVELVFTMGLLAFAFLAMGKLFVASMEHSRQGRHDMVALNSANEVLESMRSIDFNDVNRLFDGLDTRDSLSVPPEARIWAKHLEENLGPHARCEITIYEAVDKPAELSNGILEVEIFTSWIERGKERSILTGTYLVRMGS